MASIGEMEAPRESPQAPRHQGAIRNPRIRTIVACGLLASIALALTLTALGDWCTMTPDGFTYLGTARTLIETGRLPQRQLVAPPGFPVLISPLLLLGDLPFVGLRVLLGSCWAITCVLTFVLHRRELGARAAWIAAALVAVNTVLFMQTTYALSEPVFVALTTATLVVLQTWWRHPPRHAGSVILGGILIASTCMVRTMGIVLLPVALWMLVRHRGEKTRTVAGRVLLFSAFAVGPMMAWSYRQSAFPTAPAYFQILTTARNWEGTDKTGWALQLERLRTVGPTRLENVKALMVPQRLGWRAFQAPWGTLATWLIGPLFVGLAVARLWTRRSPVDAYVILTLGMLALWPWREGERFVAPLAPVLYGYFVWAGLAMARRVPARVRTVGLSAVLAVVFLAHAAEIAVALQRIPDRRAKAVRQRNMIENLAAWQEAHIPRESRWLGVTRKWDNAKVLLLGSSYLSRRPIRPFDVYDGNVSPPATFYDWAIVQRDLADVVAREWGYMPESSIEEFTAFSRSRRNPPEQHTEAKESPYFRMSRRDP